MESKPDAFLPMPPEKGPPLPRKLEATWSVLWVIVTLPYQVVKAARVIEGAIKGGRL